jgi:metal-sulfur cluster biosynthetic enzyme
LVCRGRGRERRITVFKNDIYYSLCPLVMEEEMGCRRVVWEVEVVRRVLIVLQFKECCVSCFRGGIC